MFLRFLSVISFSFILFCFSSLSSLTSSSSFYPSPSILSIHFTPPPLSFIVTAFFFASEFHSPFPLHSFSLPYFLTFHDQTKPINRARFFFPFKQISQILSTLTSNLSINSPMNWIFLFVFLGNISSFLCFCIGFISSLFPTPLLYLGKLRTILTVMFGCVHAGRSNL